MKISLKKLHHFFTKKPLLVGGKAMEYYGLRKSGKDIDLIAAEEDVVALIKQYPHRVKNLWGDLGVCPDAFEIWKTIAYLNYDDLKDGAVDIGEVLVITEEKLLLMTSLVTHKEKYAKDLQLIAANLLKKQNQKYKQTAARNEKLLRGLEVTYIEKSGPEK